MSGDVLTRLAGLIREDGGLLAAALLDDGPRPAADDPGLGSLVAGGPRAGDDGEVLALAIEAAYEGHLLHRGRSRLLDASDADLALLAGDRLYALSLATLAGAGQLAAVRELADAISLCARAQAEQAPELEQAAWEAAASAIGWGADDLLEAAKDEARGADDAAAARLRDAALRVRGGLAGAR